MSHCEKCFVELTTPKSTDDEWSKYKGDKDLWKKYSHVSIIKDGIESQKYLIVAIYRYAGGININHNMEEGSCCHICMKPHKRKKDVFIPSFTPTSSGYEIKLTKRV